MKKLSVKSKEKKISEIHLLPKVEALTKAKDEKNNHEEAPSITTLPEGMFGKILGCGG